MSEIVLREYQKVGEEFLLKNPRCILCDETGLGKTIQLLSAVKKAGGRVLIVSQKATCSQWVEAAEEKFGLTVARLDEGSKYAKDIFLKDVTLINFASLKRVPQQIQWDVVVVDEAQFVQNRKSARTKLLYKIVNGKKPAGRVWMASATPVWNKADSLWSLLHILFPSEYSSFWKFVYKFCIVTKTPFATEIKGINPSMADELRDAISPFILRRKKSDVLTELPPCVEKVVALDCDTKLRKENRHIRRVMKEWDTLSLQRLRTHLLDRDSFVFEDGERLYKGSIPAVKKKYLDTILQNEEGNKLIFLVKYQESAEIVLGWLKASERLSYVPENPITGLMPSNEREAVLGQFAQADGTSAIVGTALTIGTGLNLQAANVMVYMEHPDLYSQYVQSKGRISRIGSTKEQMIYHVLQRMTLDERAYKRCMGKAGDSDLLLED